MIAVSELETKRQQHDNETNGWRQLKSSRVQLRLSAPRQVQIRHFEQSSNNVGVSNFHPVDSFNNMKRRKLAAEGKSTQHTYSPLCRDETPCRSSDDSLRQPHFLQQSEQLSNSSSTESRNPTALSNLPGIDGRLLPADIVSPPRPHRLSSLSDPFLEQSNRGGNIAYSISQYQHIKNNRGVITTPQYSFQPQQLILSRKRQARLELVVDGVNFLNRSTTTHHSDCIDLTTKSFYRIGRSKLSDIHLQHYSLSRNHALLFRLDGSYYIVDCASLSGTHMDGKPIKSVPTLFGGRFGSFPSNDSGGWSGYLASALHDGSIVRFGGQGAPTFVFRDSFLPIQYTTNNHRPLHGITTTVPRTPPSRILKTPRHPASVVRKPPPCTASEQTPPFLPKLFTSSTNSNCTPQTSMIHVCTSSENERSKGSYVLYHRYTPPSGAVSDASSMMKFLDYSIVGDPSLQIYRLRLPRDLLSLLDDIILGCELYACTLPNGWETNLFTLTKQDIPLQNIPPLFARALPITTYIRNCIYYFFYNNHHNNSSSSIINDSCNVSGAPPSNNPADFIKLDRHQPHVLKYSAKDYYDNFKNNSSASAAVEDINISSSTRSCDSRHHTGVELHCDKCDVTANLCMSRKSCYAGGGTYFPDVGKTLKLDNGEFLLHPGSVVHAGVDITRGERYLMIMFANIIDSK